MADEADAARWAHNGRVATDRLVSLLKYDLAMWIPLVYTAEWFEKQEANGHAPLAMHEVWVCRSSTGPVFSPRSGRENGSLGCSRTA